MIRSKRDSPPWIPGKEARFRWPETGDRDEALIRDGVQDGGVNLFVLYLPALIGGSQVKVIAVGFYPDQAQFATFNLLDERQKHDWKNGKLVIIKTLDLGNTVRWGGEGFGSVYAYMGDLDYRQIAEIKRNNRNARSDLKRQSTASYLEQEIRDALEAQEDKVIDESEYVNAYTDAWFETEPVVKQTPKVSMYTGGAGK